MLKFKLVLSRFYNLLHDECTINIPIGSPEAASVIHSNLNDLICHASVTDLLYGPKCTRAVFWLEFLIPGDTASV